MAVGAMSPSRRIVPWPCVMRVRILSRNARAYPTRDYRTMQSRALRHAARRRDGDIAPYRQAARGGGTATGRTRRGGGGVSGNGGASEDARVRGGTTARVRGGTTARVRGWTERW